MCPGARLSVQHKKMGTTVRQRPAVASRGKARNKKLGGGVVRRNPAFRVLFAHERERRWGAYLSRAPFARKGGRGLVPRGPTSTCPVRTRTGAEGSKKEGGLPSRAPLRANGVGGGGGEGGAVPPPRAPPFARP